MHPIRRALYIAAGTLCVAAGLVGIVIPILPTTPLLLLAAFFYARSSERFLHWLLNNRVFGGYIRNYREGRPIPLRETLLTLAAMWLTIVLACIYVVPVWWGWLVLCGIAAGVTVHLVRRTRPRPAVETGHPEVRRGTSE